MKADEDGLTARLPDGKTETRAWSDLGREAPGMLVQLASDPGSAEECLSAALIMMETKEPTLAEKYLEQARSLGAGCALYVGDLAERAFTKAAELLNQNEFRKAAELLSEMETKYGATKWFAANQLTFHDALKMARQGVLETEAEQLYAEAAKLFSEEEYFDLKPIVETLKRDYAASQPVSGKGPQAFVLRAGKSGWPISGSGSPYGSMVRAISRSIRQAISTAQANTVIEIQDNGPYYEKVVVPVSRAANLTLRGKKGCWPVIASGGSLGAINEFIEVQAQGTELARLAIVHARPVEHQFFFSEDLQRLSCAIGNYLGRIHIQDRPELQGAHQYHRCTQARGQRLFRGRSYRPKESGLAASRRGGVHERMPGGERFDSRAEVPWQNQPTLLHDSRPTADRGRTVRRAGLARGVSCLRQPGKQNRGLQCLFGFRAAQSLAELLAAAPEFSMPPMATTASSQEVRAAARRPTAATAAFATRPRLWRCGMSPSHSARGASSSSEGHEHSPVALRGYATSG